MNQLMRKAGGAFIIFAERFRRSWHHGALRDKHTRLRRGALSASSRP